MTEELIIDQTNNLNHDQANACAPALEAIPTAQELRMYARVYAFLERLFRQGKYESAYGFASSFFHVLWRKGPEFALQCLEAGTYYLKMLLYTRPASEEYTRLEGVLYLLAQALGETELDEAARRKHCVLHARLENYTSYDYWMNKKDLIAGIVHAIQALALYGAAGLKEEPAIQHDNLGRMFAGLGCAREAFEHLEIGLALREEVGDPQRTGLSHISIAEACMMFGLYNTAFEHLTIAERIYADTDNARARGLVDLSFGRLFRILAEICIGAYQARWEWISLARYYLSSAKEIFTHQVAEPVRRIDVLSELSKVTRVSGQITRDIYPVVDLNVPDRYAFPVYFRDEALVLAAQYHIPWFQQLSMGYEYEAA